MAIIDFPVVGPYDKQRTVNFNAEDSVNWYLVKDPRGKKPEMMCGTPGLKFSSDPTESNLPIRRIIAYQDSFFSISGHVVSLGDTPIGTLSTVSGFIDFSINNIGQILLVDGVDGYIIDTNTNTLTTISDPDFPPFPVSCRYVESFFVVANGESILYYVSAPNNGLVWDFKDFAQVNTYGGNIVAVGLVNKRLFFFKETSTEVWYLSGDTDFPFRRDNNLIINTGCLSAASVHEEDGALFWLSRDNSGVSSIMVSDSVQIKRVSWDSVDTLIRSFTDPTDIQAYIYKDDGHMFYVASWTTDDYTLVYDSTSDFWHRMEMLPKKYNALAPLQSKVRHISSCHAFFQGDHYIGDYRSSKIFTMSLKYGDNDGEPIRRIRIFRHFSSPTYNQIQIDKLQIDFQSGIGDGQVTVANPNSNPKAYLSVSKNGGKSFGNEFPASLGKQGDYLVRTYWHLLGTHRDFVGKVAIYSDVQPIFMLGGAMQAEELSF